jgi:hypothetical protein
MTRRSCRHARFLDLDPGQPIPFTQMANDPRHLLAAPTEPAEAVVTPTVIDAEGFDEAARDRRWREFCLAADSYVAESTRRPARAGQPA